MITGTPNWNAAILGPDLLPIACTLEFPAFNVIISSFDPSAWPSLAMPAGTLGCMIMPDGPSQAIDELQGASSISGFDVECIDPTGALKALVAEPAFIGTTALFKVGFLPIAYSLGEAITYSDFNLMHTMQVMAPGWSSDGKIVFKLQDWIRSQVYQIFNFGGPAFWAPSLTTPPQPAGPSVAGNGQPISSNNPRWIQGNPLDIYLAVLQSEVGLGQLPNLPTSQWVFYEPPDTTTLINPNPWVDVDGILALRDQYFSGDWMEFKITDATTAKDWLEQQILKPLGLYSIVRSTGAISLKSMKSPATQTPSAAIYNSQLVGIPTQEREPPLNVVRWRVDVNNDSTQSNTSARQYKGTWVYWDEASIDQYQQQYIHECESQGMISPRGAFAREFLLADRVFRRHGFGSPYYQVPAALNFVGLELGDLVTLTDGVMLDFQAGILGINQVLCEVIDRKPGYASGRMELKLLDTRFLGETAPSTGVRVLADVTIPDWSMASPAQQATYFFIADSDGTYQPGSVAGDPIF
jgi:hypothetical protein